MTSKSRLLDKIKDLENWVDIINSILNELIDKLGYEYWLVNPKLEKTYLKKKGNENKEKDNEPKIY